MHKDLYYYENIEKLATLLHRQKGDPRTGALDTWKEAEAFLRQSASGVGTCGAQQADPCAAQESG